MNGRIEKAIDRYIEFYKDNSPGQIIPIISPYAFNMDYDNDEFDNRTYDQWDFANEIENFALDRIKRIRHFMKETEKMDNYYLPFIAPEFGTGVNSAFASAMEVTFGKNTSWADHPVKDWEDLNGFAFNKNTIWYELIQKYTETLYKYNEGDYFIQTFSHFSPLDMANGFRGSDLFYDFYDYPGELKKLLEICTEIIIEFEKGQRKYVADAKGGTVIWGVWVPGKSIFLSEDIADLCSPQIYEEFGMPYSQKVLDANDGAYIHHHAKGYHVHKKIAELNNLKCLQISWDPNAERPIDRIENVIAMNGNIPLMTRCTASDVYNKIES